MSTVDYDVKCGRCKNPEAFESFDNRRHTVTGYCSLCGRHHRHDLVTGKAEEGGGFGSYRVGFKRYARVGSFLRRVPLATRIARLQRDVDNPHIATVELTVRIRGKWKKIALKSKDKPRQHKPRTYHLAYKAPEPYVYVAGQSADGSDDIPF
jgi:hypothetical protein